MELMLIRRLVQYISFVLMALLTSSLVKMDYISMRELDYVIIKAQLIVIERITGWTIGRHNSTINRVALSYDFETS